MSLQRKKKPVEFHFVDMNDPERYKKLKVARACDFCRRRKSKCDIGVPGSGTCSNCQKHQMVCIFSPVTTNNRGNEVMRPEETLMTPQQFSAFEQFLIRFPLLQVKDGQVGYETNITNTAPTDGSSQSPPILTPPNPSQPPKREPSIKLESKMFKLYFDHIHPAFPVLLKQSITNIHSQDRLLLSRSLRYAIMALACHYFPASPSSASQPSTPGSCSSFTNKNGCSSPTSITASHIFYETAKQSINLASPRLDTVQTLLLLYKHDEIACSSKHGIYYLERAQEMIGQIHSNVPQQKEAINRTRWILFGCIGLSNLSDQRYNTMYKQFDLPAELPQPLAEENENSEENQGISSAQQHVNRFAQIANLSVLYSHTVQSLMTGSTSQLICLTQFKEIRQHWHDSLHPVTQSRLVSLCATDEDEIDILILYSAILYDMLYLLLILHYHLQNEWDSVETAYRLQRMVHTWIIRPSFTSAVHSLRMAAFALMLCLQIQMSREDDKIDYEFIQLVRQSMKYIPLDSRIDDELSELYTLLTSTNNSTHQLTPQVQQQPTLDYFSIIPQQFMNSAPSSPMENLANTPGLWSVTTNGGITTPLREEMGYANYQVTSEWIMEQQRRQDEQFQLYQLQQIPQQYQTTLPNTYNSNNTNNNSNNNNNSINYNSSSNNTPSAITPSFNINGNHSNNNADEDYFFLNPGQWSPSIEQLNQSTNYLKLHNHDHTPTREVPPFTLQDLPPPPSSSLL